MMDAKWYSVNFTNQQILQGQQTLFLRFKNKLREINGSLSPVYIYVIPEIINIDPRSEQDGGNDADYKG
jgi:hypothetical protein